ncbi:MAG: 2-isopropylmalate synthase, partial [Chloroflexi bacterium]|nr:2-isopropylmalate synthase [Chloroflexota bacterium]
VIDAGATTVNIPDTVGYATPEEMAWWIQNIRRRVPNIKRAVISVHCHNDLGLSTANTLAAVLNGVRQVEVTVNGIGERAGNASLEEVVMALHTRRDYFKLHTGIDTSQIYTTSRMVSTYTGMVVQPNKAVVGANSFAHESGIHQDGVLKERMTYEIMDAKMIGRHGSDFVLGKLSGRHGFRHRLELLGYHLNAQEFLRAFQRFKEIADRKKVVSDRDLEAIVADEVRAPAEVYRMARLQVSCGDPAVPTATVTIVGPDGREQTEVATGSGPVDAAYRAIDRIVRVQNTLEEYSVRSVTEGMDAVGEVTVRVEREGQVFLGRGAATDIIVASARAYVNALNKLAIEQGIVQPTVEAKT